MNNYTFFCVCVIIKYLLLTLICIKKYDLFSIFGKKAILLSGVLQVRPMVHIIVIYRKACGVRTGLHCMFFGSTDLGKSTFSFCAPHLTTKHLNARLNE